MKKQILYVEQDELLRNMYSLKFNNAGYNVKSCSNVEAAFEVLKAYTPDLILLDILLPKINGLVLLKSIRLNEKYDNTKALVLTNLSAADTNMHATIAESLKVNAYFVKSHTSPQKLLAAVKSII